MRLALVIAVLSACRFNFDVQQQDAAPQDAALHDSRKPTGDAGVCVTSACQAAGGTCADNVCEIIVTTQEPQQCPAGMACRVVCNGYRMCRDGVSCAGAPWCDVACIGFETCQYGVNCGDAECFVTCNGEDSCEQGITVGNGTCTSHCCGPGACLMGTSTCATDNVCN